MTNENLQPKEYVTWNNELIIELLATKMSVKELIKQLNLRCTKQLSVKASSQVITKHLIGLRADGKISLEKVIHNDHGIMVDSIWITKPLVAETNSFNSAREIQNRRGG